MKHEIAKQPAECRECQSFTTGKDISELRHAAAQDQAIAAAIGRAASRLSPGNVNYVKWLFDVSAPRNGDSRQAEALCAIAAELRKEL